MQKLKAVLFDLDGTLIDSEYFHYECWMEILNGFGLSMTYKDWVKTYAGHPLPTNCKNIKEAFKLDTPLDELIEWRERLSREGFASRDINLMPYAAEALEYFKSRGLKIALVTASPRDNVKLIFGRNGLGHYFDVMITRSDVEISKPDPETYLKAITALQLEKEDCLAFEDTLNGLRAAKAAGVTCYAVQHDESQHGVLAIADKIYLDLKAALDALPSAFEI
jgi:beta-phosphoglucomutase